MRLRGWRRRRKMKKMISGEQQSLKFSYRLILIGPEIHLK